jgi:hypothetical protein
MFSEEPTIIAGDSDNKSQYDNSYSPKQNKIKRILLIVGLVLSVIAFIVAIIIIINRYNDNIKPIELETKEDENKQDSSLPNLNGENDKDTIPTESINLDNLDIEYLSFSDFYQVPDNNIETNVNNYELPINIKIEGMNYYDLSRKINLDSVIIDLNNFGFAILENPWQNEVNDFYGIYKRLEEKQVPFLITSDFLIYYYQNMIKQVFKGIEESVFYDNLWAINKELYEIAKNRYESRLASIGNINDAILEGQRMEMAFFSVSLELLQPAAEQIASKGAIEDRTKFSEGDVEKFYFNPPSYLRDDILKEVQLIRLGKETAKSPNLLYMRDYKEFAVPKEYKADAKLNNFYLAAKWLNSVFPLEYRNDTCPDCLLDQEDWRLSMIAASLISSDFSSRSNLKSRWAMIYKLMAFFQGLREEVDYVDFRDALIKAFGEDYEVEELFDDQNAEAMANLEKLKSELLTYNFPAIRGAIDKDKPDNKKLLGFKMLTGAYWPNNYIFNRLIWPAVGKYQGQEARPRNLTACELNKQVVRCNGFSLDIANLVISMSNDEIFAENTNYINYDRESSILIDQLNRDGLWHTSNYWSTISLMESITSLQPVELPIFTKSEKWQRKNINAAVSAWINLQLPLDEFSLTPIFEGQTLGNFSTYDENVYVEPNLPLINELIATNDMMTQMFFALGLDKEINLASQIIKTIDEDLNMIKEIIVKELSGEILNEKDSERIRDFAKKYTVDDLDNNDKILRLYFPEGKKTLIQDLNKLKLLAIVHKSGDNKVIAVGPIWDYKESRN